MAGSSQDRSPKPIPGPGNRPRKPNPGRTYAGPPRRSDHKPPSAMEVVELARQIMVEQKPILLAGPVEVQDLVQAVVAEVLKRFQSPMPLDKLEKRKTRLPDFSTYVKVWHAEKWLWQITLTVPRGDGVLTFVAWEPASFAGEVKVDNQYRQWLKENQT